MSKSLPTSDLLRWLAAKTTGGVTEGIETLRARADLVEVAAAALQGGTEKEKVIALLALRDVAALEAQALARTALGDASPRVRDMAARCLAQASRQAAWSPLVGALDDPEPTVQLQVMEALTQLDPVAAVALLRARFASAAETERLNALTTAWSQWTSEWLLLARLGLGDASPFVRAAAVAAMAKEAGKATDAPLMQALTDPDEQVRLAATDALAQRPRVDADTFLPLLQDRSSSVRMLGLHTLVQRRHAGACDTVTILMRDPAPQIRKMAILAIGQLGCTAAREKLLEEVRRAPDEDDRVAVITSLGLLGGDEASAVIHTALKDPSPLVRAAAVTAWLRVAEPARAVPALLECLRDDPDWRVRSHAVSGLVKAPSEVDALVAGSLTGDPDPRVRLSATRVLADKPGAEVGNALVKALTDSAPEVRLEVARALGRRGHPEAIQALLKLESTESRRDILSEVKAALARLGPEQFEGAQLSGPERPLFDPARTGQAFATWLKDPDWYPASDRLVFYYGGELESIDLDDHVQVYRYSVDADQLRIQRDGEPVRSTAFTIETSSWETTAQSKRPGFRLGLATDVLSGTGQPLSFFCLDSLAPRGPDDAGATDSQGARAT